MTQIDNVWTEGSLSAGHESNANRAPTSKLALSRSRRLLSAAATFLTASAAAGGFGLTSVSGGVLIAHDGPPGAVGATVTSIDFVSGVSFDTPSSPRQDPRR
jgi:hypothetical protein